MKVSAIHLPYACLLLAPAAFAVLVPRQDINATESVASSSTLPTVATTVATTVPGDENTTAPHVPPPATNVPPSPSLEPSPTPSPTSQQLQQPATTTGSVGANTTSPIPHELPLSASDFQSLSLALYQEHAERNLFEYGLNYFTASDFEAAGLNKQDMDLIKSMGEQSKAQSKLLTDIIGDTAPQECVYYFPFDNVREFLDLSQKFLLWGESGVYGMVDSLDSEDAANFLIQSVGVEGRQQMVMRQFEGLLPMPVWFETRITPSMQWTLLAPYIKSCPYNPTPMTWQNFPALHILDEPDATNAGSSPGIADTPSPLSHEGQKVSFEYDQPGREVGPGEANYITKTSANGQPQFAAWISQLDVVYTPLEAGNGTGNYVQTTQPGVDLFPDTPGFAVVNGTMFVALVDQKVDTKDGNISQLDPHIVAGPAIYQAG